MAPVGTGNRTPGCWLLLIVIPPILLSSQCILGLLQTFERRTPRDRSMWGGNESRRREKKRTSEHSEVEKICTWEVIGSVLLVQSER